MDMEKKIEEVENEELVFLPTQEEETEPFLETQIESEGREEKMQEPPSRTIKKADMVFTSLSVFGGRTPLAVCK